jgi:AcrR family transcriptional regulator
MSDKLVKEPDHPAAADAPRKLHRPDGRRRRALRTRQAIIEAYLSLLGDNPQVPTAMQIAQRAGCSTRSVFERFADLPTLVLAVIDHVIGLGLSTPVGDKAEADRRTRLKFQVETRAAICEAWQPLWRVLLRRGDQVDAVKVRIEQVRTAIAARLELMYAPELGTLSQTDRRHILIGLEALTDFEAWAQMRERHGLSVEAATNVWIALIDRILPPTPASPLSAERPSSMFAP